MCNYPPTSFGSCSPNARKLMFSLRTLKVGKVAALFTWPHHVHRHLMASQKMIHGYLLETVLMNRIKYCDSVFLQDIGKTVRKLAWNKGFGPPTSQFGVRVIRRAKWLVFQKAFCYVMI